jgi:hypothetical protein
VDRFVATLEGRDELAATTERLDDAPGGPMAFDQWRLTLRMGCGGQPRIGSVNVNQCHRRWHNRLRIIPPGRCDHVCESEVPTIMLGIFRNELAKTVPVPFVQKDVLTVDTN